MNKIKSFAIIIIFSIMFFGNAFAHVVLDYPVGGETFQGNEVVMIQWHVVVPHGEADWDLFFSADGGMNWEPIVQDLPGGQLEYDWAVPNIETGSGQIEVIQDNMSGQDYTDSSGNFTIIQTAGTSEDIISSKNILLGNYPNPFNPETKIFFELENADNAIITIYDLKGWKIKTFNNDNFSSDTSGYSVTWNGRDNNSKSVPSGFYFYRLESGSFKATRKMVLMK